MAIVVLVLWIFTAGAGFFLLVTSNLSRSRRSSPPTDVSTTTPAATEAPVPAAATVSAAASTTASPPTRQAPAATPAPNSSSPSKREQKRAARDRFDTPSLTAAKNAPMLPSPRSLLEFTHPALAIIGLGFWLCFTLVHTRVLGWIAFGLVAATAALGLTWFTTNTRTAKAKKAKQEDQGEPPPSFGLRLVILHGGAATVTFALAALTALVLAR